MARTPPPPPAGKCGGSGGGAADVRSAVFGRIPLVPGAALLDDPRPESSSARLKGSAEGRSSA